jgi:hypothetical protein
MLHNQAQCTFFQQAADQIQGPGCTQSRLQTDIGATACKPNQPNWTWSLGVPGVLGEVLKPQIHNPKASA